MKTEFPKKIADNVTMFSPDPIIYVVHNFLSNLECDAFIDAGMDNLKPSTVISSSKPMIHNSRTSKNCWIPHDKNELIHEVSKRLSILVQMPIRNAEQYQLVHYSTGAQYKPHFDSFNFNSEEGKKHWKPGGQRMITVIAYLNSIKDEDGGGTIFPELNIVIPAKKGDVLVFHNTLAKSSSTTHPAIHPKSLHGGMPVKRGEKWITNLWFRQNIRY